MVHTENLDGRIKIDDITIQTTLNVISGQRAVGIFPAIKERADKLPPLDPFVDYFTIN